MKFAGSVFRIYFWHLTLQGSRGLWPSFVGNSFPEGREIEQRLPDHSVSTPVYKVTPKQPALNGPDKFSDLTGNLTNPPGMVISIFSQA